MCQDYNLPCVCFWDLSFKKYKSRSIAKTTDAQRLLSHRPLLEPRWNCRAARQRYIFSINGSGMNKSIDDCVAVLEAREKTFLGGGVFLDMC